MSVINQNSSKREAIAALKEAVDTFDSMVDPSKWLCDDWREDYKRKISEMQDILRKMYVDVVFNNEY